MSNDIKYDLRVYAEGIQLPAYGITRTQQVGAPLSFHVRIPPIPKAFSVLPNTTVHAFVRRNDWRQDGEWVLFAEGRVKGRNLKSSKSGGGLATVLRCKGMAADWDEVNMGFNVGEKSKLLDSKKTNFFYGFSTGDKDEQPFPGFQAGKAGAFLNKFRGQGSKYLSFKAGLDRYLVKGPVQAAVSILASMPAFRPLFRRNYNSLQLQNRIGYAENTQITNWLKTNDIQNILRSRIRSFKPDSSLLDIMRYILRESFHELVPLGSPPFRAKPKEKKKSKKEKKKAKANSKIVPDTVGEGDPLKTSPNAPVSELLQDPRVKAYLDVIAAAEHQTDNVQNENLYLRQFGYRVKPNRTFSLESGKHPGDFFNVSGQVKDSSAAGRYQITKTTWDRLQNEHPEMLSKFGKKEQDRAAVLLMKERDALKPLLSSDGADIVEVNDRLYEEWASLPNRAGQGVKENQNVPYTHERLTFKYNEHLRRRHGDSGSVPEGTVHGSAVERTVEVPGTLPTTLIKPTLREAPAPICNVVMPSDIEGIQVSDSFEQAPTRMMMQRNRSLRRPGRGTMAQSLFRKTTFAPRRLAYLIRQMDNAGSLEDMQISEVAKEIGEKKQMSRQEARKEVKKILGGEIKKEDEDLVGAYRALHALRTELEIMEPEKSTDMLSSVLSGETPVPDNLLSLYTLDELFRGVHPVIGEFPFPKIPSWETEMGTESNASKLENKITGEISLNDDKIADSPFAPEDTKTVEGDSEARTKYGEASESITANSIWADYQLSMLRRRPRSLSYNGPLNLNLAVGFPAALNHPALGWIEGTVHQVRDTVDVQQNSASTHVQVTHCKFHVDYETDAWRHMEMSSDGNASSLAEDGYPSQPIFYDKKKFGPNNIGQQVYEDLLQVGSVVDLAKKMGAEEPTPKEALEFLFASYSESDFPREWMNQHLTRPIATEEQVFKKAMGAKPDSSSGYFEEDDAGQDWGGTFPVYEMPGKSESKSDPSTFIEERAQWARSVRDTLRKKNFAIDATFNSEED